MANQGCILLMRHGRKKTATLLETKELDLDLSDTGKKATQETVRALAEEMDLGAGGVRLFVSQVWSSEAKHATSTVQKVYEVLQAQSQSPFSPPHEEGRLNPAKIWAQDNKERRQNTRYIIDRLLFELRENPTCSERVPAILVVGHEPQLGWLSSELIQASIPIAHSEIACIYLENLTSKLHESGLVRNLPHGIRRIFPHWSRRFLWIISPSDPAPGWNAEFTTVLNLPLGKAKADPSNADSGSGPLTALRDKIKSKMDTAKLVGGLITGALAAILSYFLDNDKFSRIKPQSQYWFAGAIVMLFASLVLYLMTMYSYDRLLMPTHFWGSGRPEKRSPRWLVARPPSPSLWVLYQNMMHIWWWQFTTATCLATGAIPVLAYATVTNSGMWNLQDCLGGAILGIGLLVLVIYSLHRWGGARLGAQD
jgi:phosphohistidine phosphatase SixA